MENKVAIISLAGELDASSASVLREEVEKAAARQAKRLVLQMQNLTYMASAGLRMLVFAKQKMGADVDIYVVAPQTPVLETLQLSGFHHSVIILDTYDRSLVEGA